MRCLLLLLLGTALIAGEGWYFQPARQRRRALAAARNGDLEEVEHELLELPAGPAYEAHAGLLAGKLLLAKGQPNKALNELALAIALPDTELPALMLAGEGLSQLGRFVEAGKAWTMVVEQDPDNLDAHRRLAAAYHELGAVWEAAYHLTQMVRLAPDDPRAYWLLGMIEREHGDAASAVARFRAALARHPSPEDRMAISLELAGVLQQIHEEQEVLSLLDECPPSVRVWELRSQCQYALGLNDEAAASLREALALDPGDRPALLLKGRMALQTGDPQSAADVLAPAVKVHVGSAAMHFTLGQAYRRLNQGDKAMVEERLAEELWAKEGQLAAQIEEAEQKPDDDQLRFEIGRLAAEVDLPELAQAWLKAALLLNPNHKQARVLLQRLSPDFRGLPTFLPRKPMPHGGPMRDEG